MSKPKSSEVIAVRVMREQEWAYARKLEHLSYREMRQAANRPPEAGGLGYDLGESALKGLVRGYLERMRDTLEDGPELTMARELADLDAQYRAMARLTSPLDEHATRRNAAVLYSDEVSRLPIDELVANYSAAIVLREDKVIIAATSQLRAIGESRRKLLGVDAPVTSKLDVTLHDAVTEELNAMLARAGAPPIERVPHE